MIYTYLNPKIALMGPGCVQEIGRHVKDLGGTKALIVSGKSRHGEALARDIYKILENADLEATIFAGADPNPTDTSAMEDTLNLILQQLDIVKSPNLVHG